jgi:hypothetical protein
MKARLIQTTVMLVALGAASLFAGPPKKQPIGRYVSLWTNSPFTVKPDEEPPEEVPNALEDYVLTGVSKLPEGYFVVLMNKKKREERVRIAPNDPNDAGFEVVKVTQDPYDYMKTEVEIAVGGGKTGLVTYEEKYLALKTPAPQKKPTPNQTSSTRRPTPTIPGMKPGTTPTRTSSTGSSPRVRRVPTPPSRR